MLADVLPKIAAETQGPRQKYRARPSSAGPERCIRSMVYAATDTPADPLPGRALLVFDDSSWHEELTADWIRKTAYQLHSQQMRVQTAVGEGSIDGMLTTLLGEDVLLEHKALNHFSCERIWKGDWPLDYITQTILYLDGCRALNPAMKRALLLIKNKNTAAYLELLLSYDDPSDTATLEEVVRSDGERARPNVQFPGIIGAAVVKFNSVDAHRIEGTLPDRPFPFGTTYPCGYCPWETTCWAGYEAEVEALADTADLEQDLQDLAAYYLQTSAQVKDMEKEQDDLKEKIKALLLAKGIRAGKGGGYTISLTLQKRDSLDQEKIPLEILAAARKVTTFERLTIRKLKEKGGKT